MASASILRYAPRSGPPFVRNSIASGTLCSDRPRCFKSRSCLCRMSQYLLFTTSIRASKSSSLMSSLLFFSNILSSVKVRWHNKRFESDGAFSAAPQPQRYAQRKCSFLAVAKIGGCVFPESTAIHTRPNTMALIRSRHVMRQQLTHCSPSVHIGSGLTLVTFPEYFAPLGINVLLACLKFVGFIFSPVKYMHNPSLNRTGLTARRVALC